MVLRRKLFSRIWTISVVVCVIVLLGQREVEGATTTSPTTTTADPAGANVTTPKPGTTQPTSLKTAAATTTPNATATTIAQVSSTAADHCSSNPCINGNCTTIGTDFNCTCNPGFVGKNCSTDIDECRNDTACAQNAKCTNTAGSYNCTCNPGFDGDGLKICTDIDECSNTTACAQNATCTNTAGSYNCTCNPGFDGDGLKNCTDIDECRNTTACAQHATCTNTAGSYNCTCNPGFDGDGLKNCTDIDECSNTKACAQNAKCTNTAGSYKCTCNPGFDGDGLKNCTDIDECSNTTACAQNATCTNTAGSYNCTCNPGFDGDGLKNCTASSTTTTLSTPAPTTSTDGTSGKTTTGPIITSTPPPTSTTSSPPSKTSTQTNSNATGAPTSSSTTITTESSTGTTASTMSGGSTDTRTQSSTRATTTKASTTTTSTAAPTTTTAVDHCSPNPCVNGNCTNIGTDYNCTCNPGFMGKNCSTDVDECKTGDHHCHKDANCINTPGSYNCTCKNGFEGDGKNCTDINECTKNPCAQHASCTNTAGSFICKCNPGFEGDGLTNCNDTDECKTGDHHCHKDANCINTPGSYNCTCKKGFEGDGKNCTDVDECNPGSYPCHKDADCINTPGSYNCTCKPGFEGNRTHCTDIDECKDDTHACHPRANCTNTVGNHTCTCKEGFTGDGKVCKDIDECAEGGEANCTANNTLLCYNKVGSWECICVNGWEGDHCENDVDECDDDDRCSSNANCTNTPGSYTCKCNDGYRGDGVTCTEIVLFSLPDEDESYVGDDETFGPFRVPGGLPYQQAIYYNCYVSMNGYITLGRSLNSRYPPRSAANWKAFETPIIAPLWADIQMQSPSALLINRDIKNTTYLEDIVDKSKEDLGSPRFGFMATWRKAVPYPYKQNKDYESADFQVAIVSNGSKTLLIFNYDQEVFTWDPTVVGGRLVSIGYTRDASFDGKVLFNQENFTQANNDTNSGINGRWVFDVSQTNTGSEAGARCQDWLTNDKIQEELKRAHADICPCSYWQARRDSRFRYTGWQKIESRYYYVYTSRFIRRQHFKQRCHYDWSYWNLVSGYPGGGYLTELPSSNLKIEEAYEDCCSSSTRLCRQFYLANPSDRCLGYRPPPWRPSWGDPHITTLDNKTYTFNGRGEYILLQNDNAKVQARTELQGNNTDATVFTGLAAQELDGDKIELALDKTAKAVKVYVNGVENVTYPGNSVNITGEGVDVYEAENSTDYSLVVALESGISIQVTVSDILNLVVSGPNETAEGLAGTLDGDNFVLRNGSTLPADSTEETLFQFGASWNLHNASESLFNYTDEGKNFTYYNNKTISPTQFIGDIENITSYLSEKCPSGSINETAINTICKGNKACIIDAAGTCNTTFGENTKKTEEAVEKEAAILENEPPVFSNNESEPIIVFRANTTVQVEIDVSDTSNNFTVKAITNATNHNLTGKVFTWYIGNDSLSDLSKSVSVKFIATDNLEASSEYWPTIYYCGCMQETECNYIDIEVESNPDRFYRAKCDCSNGMTGTLCETVIDVCKPSPCYEGGICNSSNPEKLCEDCPPGYEGDGIRCDDVNECRDGTSGCSHNCNNTQGSYHCFCPSGFTPNSDNHTCDDINECIRGSHNCNVGEYCRNLPGSFECPCLPGYIKQNQNGSCQKQQLTFVMEVVFEAVRTDEKEFPDAIKTWTKLVFGSMFIQIDVRVPQALTRKRRDVGGLIEKFIRIVLLHSNDSSLSTDTVKEKYEKYKAKHGVDLDTSDVGLKPFIAFLNESGIYKDIDSPLCEMEFVSCDPVSTNCSVKNGIPMCACKPGFEEWLVENQSCKDIDECKNASTVCQGGECTNTVGSFHCTCQPGFRYDKVSRCEDLCEQRPCQNGGECIHGTEEGQYVCKCDDKWAGMNCETENQETKRLKTIAIVVGAVVGGVCLLLVLALFGVWRRSMSRTRGYKQHLSSSDNGYNFDYLRTSNPTQSMTEIPYKSDENDATSSFSIPRARLSRSELKTTDLDAYSNEGATKDDGQYSKINEDKSAQQPLTSDSSSSQQRLSGKENPSFLHNESTAELRRSMTSGKNRNSYEYF